MLHIAARTQARTPGHPGQVYVHRRMAEGKTNAEAIRALKWHISKRHLTERCSKTRKAEVSGEDSSVASQIGVIGNPKRQVTPRT